VAKLIKTFYVGGYNYCDQVTVLQNALNARCNSDLMKLFVTTLTD